MLLEPTVLPRIKHFLISIPLLGEQAFENAICALFIDVLFAD